MNSIQLDLFAQELIRIKLKRPENVIIFKFKGGLAWVDPQRLGSIKRILEGAGIEKLDVIFLAVNYRKFVCDVGTWERLCLEEEFKWPGKFLGQYGINVRGESWVPIN